MRKNTALKILNLILVVFFANQLVTVLFLEELPRWAFQIFHKGGGTILLGLIILHIILNFNWIKASYFPK